MESEKRQRWSTVTFLLAFALTLALVAWISLGFLIPLTIALSAAILLGHINEWVVKRFGGRRGVTALLMTFGAVLLLMGPLAFIVVKLVTAAIPLVDRIADSVANGRFEATLMRLVPDSLEERLATLDVASFEAQVRQGLAGLAGGLAGFVTSLPATVGAVLVDLFVMMVALYSFFVNGPRLKHQIIEATPMERQYTRHLLDTIALAIRTVFAASMITALIQFVLGYIAFRIVDVPFALGLAAVMGFFSFVFSLIPVLGSGMVWGPLGVVLLVTGRPVAGLLIIAFGILVLGSVDNVVKPLYAKGKLRLSPLVVFVMLFGGIAVFGPIGAVLGPLLAALAAAFLHIWTTDFLEDAEPPPAPERKPKRRWKLARLRRVDA